MTTTAQVRPWYMRLASFIPSWMQDRPELEVFYKTLFVWALMCDIATQVCLEGVRAAWPGYDGRTDNLPYIGASRSLLQGETEASKHFAMRLQRWLQTARDMGGDAGLVREISEYLGNAPMVRLWSRSGKCATTARGATIASVSGGVATITGLVGMVDSALRSPPALMLYDAANPGNNGCFPILSFLSSSSVTIANANAVVDPNNGSLGWVSWSLVEGGLNWDSISDPRRVDFWWDHWLIIYPDENAYAPTISNGSRAGVIASTDPRRALGIGHLSTRTQADSILGILKTWKGQHAVIRLIVWTTNSALFDPTNPTETGNPNGRWGRPSFWGECPSGTVGSGIGQWPSRRRVDCRYRVPGS